MMIYSSVQPIGVFISDLLQKKYNLSSVTAGELQGSVYLVAGILLPVVGFFCDRFGKLTFVMIGASLLCLSANLCWVFLPNTCIEDDSCMGVVVTPILLMGCSYALFAGTAWNALCYIVREDQIGLALGIASSLLNIGCTLIPPLMGKLQDHTMELDQGYYWVTRLSSLTSLIAVALCIALHFYDICKNSGHLSMSVKKRN